MIVSKFTGKDGKTRVSFIVDRADIRVCKNPDFFSFTKEVDFMVGLDAKNQAKLSDIINVDKLIDNTKK